MEVLESVQNILKIKVRLCIPQLGSSAVLFKSYLWKERDPINTQGPHQHTGPPSTCRTPTNMQAPSKYRVPIDMHGPHKNAGPPSTLQAPSKYRAPIDIQGPHQHAGILTAPRLKTPNMLMYSTCGTSFSWYHIGSNLMHTFSCQI